MTTTCLTRASFCSGVRGFGFGFGFTWCFLALWCFGGFLAAAPPATASSENAAASRTSSASLRCDIDRLPSDSNVTRDSYPPGRESTRPSRRRRRPGIPLFRRFVLLGDSTDERARCRTCPTRRGASRTPRRPCSRRAARRAGPAGDSSSPTAASRTAARAAFAASGVPLSAHARGALELATLRLRVDPQQLDAPGVVLLVAVDADDRALARLDLLLPLEGGLLDLVLHEAPLDRLDRAAELVDALDQLPRARLELVRQRTR